MFYHLKKISSYIYKKMNRLIKVTTFYAVSLLLCGLLFLFFLNHTNSASNYFSVIMIIIGLLIGLISLFDKIKLVVFKQKYKPYFVNVISIKHSLLIRIKGFYVFKIFCEFEDSDKIKYKFYTPLYSIFRFNSDIVVDNNHLVIKKKNEDTLLEVIVYVSPMHKSLKAIELSYKTLQKRYPL